MTAPISPQTILAEISQLSQKGKFYTTHYLFFAEGSDECAQYLNGEYAVTRKLIHSLFLSFRDSFKQKMDENITQIKERTVVYLANGGNIPSLIAAIAPNTQERDFAYAQCLVMALATQTKS